MNIDPKKIARMISEDPNEVAPSDHFDDTEDEYKNWSFTPPEPIQRPDIYTEIRIDLISRGDDQDKWDVSYVGTVEPLPGVEKVTKRPYRTQDIRLQGVLTIYHTNSDVWEGWHWSSTDKKWEPDHATDEIQQILDCFTGLGFDSDTYWPAGLGEPD